MKRYYVLLFVLVFSKSLISQIHVDQNNKVGIGTSSIDASLEVAGRTDLNGYLRIGGGGNIWIQGTSNSTPNSNPGSQNTLIGYNVGNSNGMPPNVYNNFFLGTNTAKSVSTICRNNVVIAPNGFDVDGGDDNVVIGNLAFNGVVGSKSANVAIGWKAMLNYTGDGAAVGIGPRALESSSSVATAIGAQSMRNSVGALNTTAVGSTSGFNADGQYCVYLGYRAGMNNNTDNLLFIDNSETPNPLIWGDFSANVARINGELEVSDFTGGTPVKMLARDASNQIVETTPSFTNPILSIGGSNINISDVNYWSKLFNTGSIYTLAKVGIGHDNPDYFGNASLVVRGRIVRQNGNLYNDFTGHNAGNLSATGNYNIAQGYETGQSLTDGEFNVIQGFRAGKGLKGGSYNVFSGLNAGWNSVGGDDNIAFGRDALYGNVNGSDNIALGRQSLNGNSGNYNIGIGFQPLWNANNTTKNVAIGYQAGYFETGSNKLHIANNPHISLIEGDFSSNELLVNGKLQISNFIGGTPVKMLARDASNQIIEADLPSAGIGGIEVGKIINSVAPIIDDSGNPQFYITSDDLNIKIDEPTSNTVNITQQNHLSELRASGQTVSSSSYIDFGAVDNLTNGSIIGAPSLDNVTTTDAMPVLVMLSGTIRQTGTCPVQPSSFVISINVNATVVKSQAIGSGFGLGYEIPFSLFHFESLLSISEEVKAYVELPASSTCDAYIDDVTLIVKSL